MLSLLLSFFVFLLFLLLDTDGLIVVTLEILLMHGDLLVESLLLLLIFGLQGDNLNSGVFSYARNCLETLILILGILLDLVDGTSEVLGLLSG